MERRILRAVGDPQQRFREDSLRILRGVRFAVRFRLQPEEQTLAAMKELAPLMDNLARERVFDELQKLLPMVTAEDLLRYRQILGEVIPELKPTFDFDQHNPHHAYDLFTHIAHVTGHVPPVPELRWAALMHDLGKVSTFTLDDQGRGHFYGHAAVSARMADEILRRLKAPTALREQVVFLVEKHMNVPEPERRLLLRRLRRDGRERTQLLLQLQRADFGSKGTGPEEDPVAPAEAMLREILQEAPCLSLKDLAVNGRDLGDLGCPPGREMGRILNLLLEQVGEERLPNERSALLAAAKAAISKQNT